MKAHVWSFGDDSVGIPGASTDVDICFDADVIDEDDMRQFIRDRLSECFSQIWDDKVHVMFEDEIEEQWAELEPEGVTATERPNNPA